MSDHVNGLIEARHKAWHAAKEILDRCVAEKRERSAEENEMFERANADIDRLGREIEDYKRQAEVEAENDVFRSAFEGVINPDTDKRESAIQAASFEHYLRTGDASGLVRSSEGGVLVDITPAVEMSRLIRSGRSADEVRALYTGSTSGSLLAPTTFVRELYQYMEASSAVRQLARVFSTAGGEAMDFPKVGTHAIGTQVATEATALAGTDPTFEKLTLNAYRYGQLIKLSTSFIQDSGVPVESFVAQDIGRALGRITDTAYVTGGGSTTPNGIVNAAGTGVKTGGSLIPLSFDNLIDLQMSVVAEYRANASWVMNDFTAGSLRKIRAGAGDTAGTILGQYLWEPSTQAGQPDMLLGRPVYTDVNFASQGSAARSVAFGDFSKYYIRDVGSVRLERSDDVYFAEDAVAFRGIIRTDGDLVDLNAVKTTAQLP